MTDLYRRRSIHSIGAWKRVNLKVAFEHAFLERRLPLAIAATRLTTNRLTLPPPSQETAKHIDDLFGVTNRRLHGKCVASVAILAFSTN